MNTEIQKIFVSLEIAKLMDEKQFNGECLAYYDEFGELDLFNKPLKNSSMLRGFTTPTFEQATDWLEEKHQIFIEIGVDCTTYPKFCYSVNKFFGNPKDLTEKEWGWEHPKPKNWYLYKSRKEAVEEAIKFSLTLI